MSRNTRAQHVGPPMDVWDVPHPRIYLPMFISFQVSFAETASEWMHTNVDEWPGRQAANLVPTCRVSVTLRLD